MLPPAPAPYRPRIFHPAQMIDMMDVKIVKASPLAQMKLWNGESAKHSLGRPGHLVEYADPTWPASGNRAAG